MGNNQNKPSNQEEQTIENKEKNEEQNKKQNEKNISKIMDYVATNYILSMDFESLQKLYTKRYCDKMIVLTSDIIQKYFTNMDITYLSNKIKLKDNLIFINRNDLETIDELDPQKKRDLCNGIAKFYITIAHVFACILTTINPLYIYKDLNGEYKKIPLSQRNKIPYGIKTKILKYNICDNRIKSLKNNSIYDSETGDLTINPSFCNINLNESGELKSLIDEPGIPELVELYNDEDYNFEKGTFSNMSPETKQMFQENLKIFYTTFTGNLEMPPEITKFSDIKLRDYDKDGKCSSNLVGNPVSGNISNELFKQYAINLKEMISKSNSNRESLVSILNKLFVYFIDEETKAKRIRINPDLTEESLQNIVVETRSAVIKLYLGCEQDYVEGIKIYEAIVEQKILETSQKQVETLKKMRNELMTNEDFNDENIKLPEDKIIMENYQKQLIIQEAQEKINEIDNQQTQQPENQEQPIQEQPIQEKQTQQPIQEQPIQEQPIQEQPTQQPIQEQPTQQPIQEQQTQQPIQEQPTQQPIQEQPTQQPIQEQPTQQPIQEQLMGQIQQPIQQVMGTNDLEKQVPMQLEIKQKMENINQKPQNNQLFSEKIQYVKKPIITPLKINQ